MEPAWKLEMFYKHNPLLHNRIDNASQHIQPAG
jgi:hypothetical protein